MSSLLLGHNGRYFPLVLDWGKLPECCPGSERLYPLLFWRWDLINLGTFTGEVNLPKRAFDLPVKYIRPFLKLLRYLKVCLRVLKGDEKYTIHIKSLIRS